MAFINEDYIDEDDYNFALAIENSLMVNQRLPNNSGVRVERVADTELNGSIAPDAAFEQACELSLACEQNPEDARKTIRPLVEILRKFNSVTLSPSQSYAKDLNAFLRGLSEKDNMNDNLRNLFFEFLNLVNIIKKADAIYKLNDAEMHDVNINCWRFVEHFLTLAHTHDIINIFNNENITNTIFPYLLIEINISEKQAQNFINEMVLILHP